MRVSGWEKHYGRSRAGIRFNNRIFTEPARFSLAPPPVSSGIYAILAPDTACRPRPFRAIYLGESGNFSQRVTGDHERFNDWAAEAGGAANLYVAFCSTPLLKEQQRRWIEYDLVARYRPACNLRGNQIPFFYQPLLSAAK
jgi:hypothetical protein